MLLDPATVERSASPNDYLVCPTDRCRSRADADAPVFDRPASAQMQSWRMIIEAASRSRVVAQRDDLLVGTQRSRLLGFVDDIAIRVIPLDDARSTFSAYSRSRVGVYDFGVNERRLKRWMDALEDLMRSPAGAR